MRWRKFVEENLGNAVLRNALQLHDIVSIPSPWFKKNLGCGTSKCYKTTWFCCNSFTLFEVNFENAALRNALKLQDFDPIPSPWLKKILNTLKTAWLDRNFLTLVKENFGNVRLWNTLKLYDLDIVPSLWLRKILKMWHAKMP